MRTGVPAFLGLLILGATLLFFPPAGGGQGAPADIIRAVRISGVINPVVADFITAELDHANGRGQKAFLLELDTPGGLDTAMRSIIQGLLGSRIPTIVYVYPPGARAASAGALITLAADFAVMAPGTNLGAAHPVAIGPGGSGDEKNNTMMEKVVEDAAAYARSIAEQRGRNTEWAERIVRESISTSATEALDLKVIDLIAADRQALLEGLDGRRYLRNGQGRFLKTAGAEFEQSEMGLRQRILNVISNPNVAYMLLMLGILGIFFEISQPGVILPGAIGALALLLAFFGFQTLPVNYVGVLLIVLAVILFILEVAVTSYGMLAVGGLVALTFGSLMLVETSKPYLQISREVIFAAVGVSAGFLALVIYHVVRTQKGRPVSGSEGMAGECGVAVDDFGGNGEGLVFVHGEYWNASCAEPVAKGQRVEVVRVGGNMRLEVKKTE